MLQPMAGATRRGISNWLRREVSCHFGREAAPSGDGREPDRQGLRFHEPHLSAPGIGDRNAICDRLA
jgi:hypothetical protein